MCVYIIPIVLHLSTALSVSLFAERRRRLLRQCARALSFFSVHCDLLYAATKEECILGCCEEGSCSPVHQVFSARILSHTYILTAWSVENLRVSVDTSVR